MSALFPIDQSQPLNELGLIGQEQRNDKIKINDFQKSSNEYSSANKDALSDGDVYGKGTGIFLDINNGGSSEDITQRKEQIKGNQYQKNKPYTTPSV